eukprot:TRINITY_DN9667_c0_g1_i2.p1 TRINITY_DN9667_c0_g1~~TRINITY_DN9667_c0_g1_i2.p1  ORF type:complete len:538 (-),score=114.20 TRINITY_DN9667_c0_g1_i2:306-1859(-)
MASNHPRQCFVFVFPMASGHINPSLPIARSLVKQGHEVHYVCAEQMRTAIQDTGATFHSERVVEPELFEGRPDDLMEVFAEIQKENGLEGDVFLHARFYMKSVILELRLPGLIRFLQEMKPSAVVYCPLSSTEAAWAAKHEDIPHVGLNTIAGPGALKPAMENFAKRISFTLEELDESVRTCQCNLDAVKRIQSKYGFELDTGLAKPFGRLPHLAHAALTLVTTTEDFYDPIDPELQETIEADDARFVAVGALLDEAGATRAAGHKSNHHASKDSAESSSATILEKVSSARKAGRKIVFASMGTVITGDFEGFGWEGRSSGADGKLRGLSGRELCQGVWGGIFDAFGAEAEEGPLLVVALGPQPNALGDLVLPANALCAPELPQVDLLKAGVDLFLTHGGQNSFTEALSTGTPLIVCPGFGDQVVNAQKAVSIGVGLKVDRPDPDAGQEPQAAAAYRSAVKTALLEVFSNSDFRAAATRCAENLQRAGGVPRAVQLILAAAKGKTAMDSAAAIRAGA